MDATRAYDLAEFVCGNDDDCQAYLEWLGIRTVNRLGYPLFWPLVEALAGELEAAGTLSWRRARTLLYERASDRFDSL